MTFYGLQICHGFNNIAVLLYTHIATSYNISVVVALINNYTGMFPVGDTSCRTLIAVCVCACVCGYVGCHYATNVSNFGYEPIKLSSLNNFKMTVKPKVCKGFS